MNCVFVFFAAKLSLRIFKDGKQFLSPIPYHIGSYMYGYVCCSPAAAEVNIKREREREEEADHASPRGTNGTYTGKGRTKQAVVPVLPLLPYLVKWNHHGLTQKCILGLQGLIRVLSFPFI